MAPVAGSAYTYAYTTLGEIFAWIIGWDLILEYAMGCATVASAWTGYLNKFLLAAAAAGCRFPGTCSPIRSPGRRATACPGQLALGVHHGGGHHRAGAGHPRERPDQRPLVVIKLVVVVFVVAVGWAYVQPGQLDERALLGHASLPEEQELPKLGPASNSASDAAAKQTLDQTRPSRRGGLPCRVVSKGSGTIAAGRQAVGPTEAAAMTADC